MTKESKRKNNLSYFEQRVANNQWRTLNNLENTMAELIEVYDKATQHLVDELLKLSEEIERKGLSRSRYYLLNYLRDMEEVYIRELAKLGKKVKKTYTKALAGAVTSAKYYSKKELGTKSFESLEYLENPNFVKKLLETKYKGATFKSRLGRNNAVLVRELKETLERGLTTGQSITQMTLNLRNKMNSNLNDTMRLVRTETMHHLNDVKLKSYKDSKVVTHVKDVVVLDSRTSDQCSSCAGKIYKIEDAPVLPRHPNCRCVLVPYIDVKKVSAELKEKEDKIKEKFKN